MTHICVGILTSTGSDNGLSPGRCHAIIWTNAGILLIELLGTKFSEILITIQAFSFKKMHLRMSSAKWRLFRLGLNVFTLIPVWTSSNYISYKVWGEVTYPSPNFNGCTVEVWVWISNFIFHTLLGMWLLIHNVIKFNHVGKRGHRCCIIGLCSCKSEDIIYTRWLIWTTYCHYNAVKSALHGVPNHQKLDCLQQQFLQANSNNQNNKKNNANAINAWHWWPFVMVAHCWPVDSRQKVSDLWKTISCQYVVM